MKKSRLVPYNRDSLSGYAVHCSPLDCRCSVDGNTISHKMLFKHEATGKGLFVEVDHHFPKKGASTVTIRGGKQGRLADRLVKQFFKPPKK